MCLSAYAANAAPESNFLAERQYQNLFAEQQYQNQFDKKLVARCHRGEGMYRVHSVHNNKKEDRVWSWDCRRVLKHGYPKCRQTGYVNSFDKPMFFMCGRNQYIYGVESYHNNRHEDRRWKFTCCSASGHKTKSCRHTGFVNEFDRPLLFQARHKEVITGVYSYHNNRKE